jgi:hypothetical protein
MPGRCLKCKGVVPKSSMTRHLAKCLDENPGPLRLHYLVVDQGPYFLHLEAAETATLGDLDRLLRKIWLECCDHMSGFQIGGERYDYDPYGNSAGGDADPRISGVIGLRERVVYEYDFGSTTRPGGRMVRAGTGQSRPEPLRLVARNEPPAYPCAGCGQGNCSRICRECSVSERITLCEPCAAQHKCGEESVVRLGNSPRDGVCAYAGP